MMMRRPRMASSPPSLRAVERDTIATRGASARVALGEVAAGDDRDAHGREVTRRHRDGEAERTLVERRHGTFGERVRRRA